MAKLPTMKMNIFYGVLTGVVLGAAAISPTIIDKFHEPTWEAFYSGDIAVGDTVYYVADGTRTAPMKVKSIDKTAKTAVVTWVANNKTETKTIKLAELTK